MAWTAHPFHGEAPGGDRFLLELAADGALCFLFADAAGHGAPASRLWERHAQALDAGWRTFVGGGDLPAALDPLDASLTAGPAEDSACVTLGRWEPGGALTFATCGYGTHALARTAAGPWWAEAEALFGLKLGWFGPERRAELPRGLVRNTLERVDRVILLSDGLLEDDHRDPEGSLATLSAANARCAPLPFEEVMPAVLELAPDPVADDLTVVVLELGGT